jgi:hypothetical protein
VEWPYKAIGGDMERLFSTGHTVITPTCQWALIEAGLETIDKASAALSACLTRHVSGDWGEVCREDSVTNDEALVYGNRILSAYTVAGVKLWIITEADRSVTTVLLPEDY